MLRRLEIPPLYPILDAGLLLRAGLSIEAFAQQLRDAGIRFLQYRDKDAAEDILLERAKILRRIFPPEDSCLILNDRAPLVRVTGFDGVHVGQEDLAPNDVRLLVGAEIFVGVSTHGEEQILAATSGPADYLAVGPVYATSSKDNPDPVVGLDGVRQARALTSKPLIAIGGINRSNCAAVLHAGADAVAVISDLIPRPGDSIRRTIEEFMSALKPESS